MDEDLIEALFYVLSIPLKGICNNKQKIVKTKQTLYQNIAVITNFKSITNN